MCRMYLTLGVKGLDLYCSCADDVDDVVDGD